MNKTRSISNFDWVWRWLASSMSVGMTFWLSESAMALSAVEVGKIAKSPLVSQFTTSLRVKLRQMPIVH